MGGVQAHSFTFADTALWHYEISGLARPSEELARWLDRAVADRAQAIRMLRLRHLRA